MAAPKHAAKKKKRIRPAMPGNWDMPAALQRLKRPVPLVGVLILASLIMILLVALPAAGRGRDSLVSTMSLSGKGTLEIKGASLAQRAIDQKNQIHLEETTAQAGDIPAEEVWVLNDPFFPLIGDPGTLSDDTGTLDSKLAHILGRPVPPSPTTIQLDAGGNPSITGGSTTSTTGAAVGITSAQTGKVLLVEQITESRGIMYARIKVDSQVYDNVRAGTTFAENYKIAEFKDYQTVVILCGDERYELQVGQLRRI